MRWPYSFGRTRTFIGRTAHCTTAGSTRTYTKFTTRGRCFNRQSSPLPPATCHLHLLARQLLTCLPLADCRLPPPARSKNPNPWSGLSFHPAEAAVYFTSALPVLLLPYPYWVFRVHLLGLMLTPANGHQGHAQGGADVLGVRHHYVHHVQFNCNFGSPTPLWDTLCGTGARAVSAADAPAKQE
jgi:hypothetical protein